MRDRAERTDEAEPAGRPDRPSQPGPPPIGFVATHPHEGRFLRCNAGLIGHLTPGRVARAHPVTDQAMPRPRWTGRTGDVSRRVRCLACGLMRPGLA